MVIAAILKVDDFRSEFPDGIEVLACDYAFSQQINAKGEPIGIPQGGTINMVINSVNSASLMSWMFQNIRMNGTISFSDDTGDRNTTIKIFKTLKFEEAFLISYHEAFSGSGTTMTTNLTLTTRKITISDKTHENLWTNKSE